MFYQSGACWYNWNNWNDWQFTKVSFYLVQSLAILRSPQCTLPGWRAHSSCSTSCLPGKTHPGAEEREEEEEEKREREEEEGKEEGKKRSKRIAH